MSKSFDISAFSGWSSLTYGTYIVQLQASGDPLVYKDSDLSSDVEVEKLAPPIILNNFTLDQSLTSLILEDT